MAHRSHRALQHFNVALSTSPSASWACSVASFSVCSQQSGGEWLLQAANASQVALPRPLHSSSVPSSSMLSQQRFSGPESWLAGGAQSIRHAHMHLAPKPQLTNEVDTVYIDKLLEATLKGQLEALALPVLQHSQQFNPQQTARTLERVPRIVDWQLQRLGGLAPRVLSPEQQQLMGVLVGKLAARLEAVAPLCSVEELARALWGIGAAYRRQPLPQYDSITRAFDASARHLQGCMSEQQPQPLAPLCTIVWAAAAAQQGSSSEVRGLASAVAQRIAQLSPDEAVGSLDHRSIAKLACALSALGLKHQAAAHVLASTTTRLLTQQLEAHDPSSGPLQPRYFYRYRTVRNGLEVTTTPKPPRPSKYIHDNSPAVVPRDFELATLAPTLRALGALDAVTPSLLDAATRQLLASRSENSLVGISSSSSSSADAGSLPESAKKASLSSSDAELASSSAGLSGSTSGTDSTSGRIAQPPAALAVLRALLGARMPLSPRMAGHLLLSIAAADRGHAPRTARTLRLAVGCGLPASHPVVRLLLQQLSDAMSAPAAAAAAAGRLGSQAQKDAQEQQGLGAEERTHSGSRRDASKIIDGAEGGYMVARKRMGYRVKQEHLRERALEHRANRGDNSRFQQVAQLSPHQAALTACAVVRSGAQGEGMLSMLDDLVAQATTPSQAFRPSWSSVTRSLSRIFPFSLKSQDAQSHVMAAESARSAHAQARLLLALARMTQRQERSERFEAQRRKLVTSLSSAPSMAAKDVLRVALALALWKSPGKAAETAQQHSNEVGQWVMRVISAHVGREAVVEEHEGKQEGAAAAAAEAGAQQGDVSSGAEGASMSEVQRGAARAEQGGEAAEAAAKEEQVERERRAAAAAAERERRQRKREEGERAAAVEFSRALPVGHVRVLASAVAGAAGQRGSPVPPYVLNALQERAGFV